MADQQSLQAGSVVVIRRQRWRIVSIRAYPRCKVLALTAPASSMRDKRHT
jgi:hypothetical protein